MSMMNLTFDQDRHYYAFGEHDRVLIEGVAYRVPAHARNEDGWTLELDDHSGRFLGLTHAQLSAHGSAGRIRVERDFYSATVATQRLATGKMMVSELPEKMAARFSKKNAYVEAFLELYYKKLIKMTDAAISASKDLLRSRAMDYVRNFFGGEGVLVSEDISKAPSARVLRRWIRDHAIAGVHGLVDSMYRRGKRDKVMGAEENALMMKEVNGYANEKRPTVKKIHENVEIAFRKRNEERALAGLLGLRIPNYETVRRAVKTLDPYHVTLKREGLEAARKKFMPVGTGLQLTMPLERVEIDEMKVDIVSLTESWGLMAMLTPEEKKALGLDKSTTRWLISVAICARTRCVLAMVFSRTAGEQSSLRTLQMLLRDKGKWADAAMAHGSWDMHGTPMLIVSDNGSAFKAERFRIACADAGISFLRAPAGIPELRGKNERFFCTLNAGVVTRLPGRTFESIRAKGDADPSKSAALTFDDLAFCLVRWIVDIYHNTPHGGLGGETPLECWRRLTRIWGVQPPPDAETMRAVFGQRLDRKLTKEGVRVMNVQYHSHELARFMKGKGERDVKVRWHPDNIGAVTVYAGGQKMHVPAMIDGLDGVSAMQWKAACRHLSASDPNRREFDQAAARAAIRAIVERSTRATTLAGLLVDEWTPERIAYEEEKLFMNFRKSDAAPTAVAADRIGVSIADFDFEDARPEPEEIAVATKDTDGLGLGASIPDHDAPATAARPSRPWNLTE